jgi:hypothetical protein
LPPLRGWSILAARQQPSRQQDGGSVGLDLNQISRQIRAMSLNAANLQGDDADRLAQLRSRLAAENGNESRWAAIADASLAGANWLLARPVEAFATQRACPSPPADYALIACDGSQIDLDRHGQLDYALINIGRVFLQYGSRPLARLDSRPQLLYRDEDLYIRDGTRRIAIEGNYLSARRDVAEGLSLLELADEHLSTELPNLALLDGTLVRWTLAGAERSVRDSFLTPYLAGLEQLRQRRIPVAAYISRSRAPEISGLLRLMFCPDVDLEQLRGADCARCSDARAGREPSCMICQGSVDVDIFADRLSEGQRGPLFLSMSRINLEAYGVHRIHFFLLRVGNELARVEVPAWVADDAELLDRVHAIVYDQASRGGGYPVALSRAHEQAVVHAADRAAFSRMLLHALQRADVTLHESAKRHSKRSISG